MNVAEHADELLRSMTDAGLTVEMKARGMSMFPTLIPGQKLIVEPITKERQLQRGDIIAFSMMNALLVAHRVVGVTPDGYVTRGDSMIEPDGVVVPDEVIGRVVKASFGKSFFRLDVFPFRIWGRLQMAMWPVSSWLNRIGAVSSYRILKFLRVI